MMLACYYSKNADFKELFDKMQISKSPSYSENLNKHNVIFMAWSDPTTEYRDGFTIRLISDLEQQFSNVIINKNDFVGTILNDIYIQASESFIFILDEWNYIFNNNLFSKGERKQFLEKASQRLCISYKTLGCFF